MPSDNTSLSKAAEIVRDRALLHRQVVIGRGSKVAPDRDQAFAGLRGDRRLTPAVYKDLWGKPTCPAIKGLEIQRQNNKLVYKAAFSSLPNCAPTTRDLSRTRFSPGPGARAPSGSRTNAFTARKAFAHPLSLRLPTTAKSARSVGNVNWRDQGKGEAANCCATATTRDFGGANPPTPSRPPAPPRPGIPDGAAATRCRTPP